MLFSTIVVNQARIRTSNDVARPKYCSTMYRYLEMDSWRTIKVLFIVSGAVNIVFAHDAIGNLVERKEAIRYSWI